MSNTVKYQNRYGECELELVTSFMSVQNINSGMDAVKANTFDIDTAEKLALISGNRKLQQVPFAGGLDMFYVLHHQTPSVVAVCKIKSIHYSSDKKPETELSLRNKVH